MAKLYFDAVALVRSVLPGAKVKPEFTKKWIVEVWNENAALYEYLVSMHMQGDDLGARLVPALDHSRDSARITTESIARQCADYLTAQGRIARAVLK